jgi:transposase
VHALIFTAVYSRHCYVHLSFRQDLPAVIAGCEAAWAFFGGIFQVIIPDNMSPVVDRAARLDNSHDTEMRKLLHTDLLILDDFCLQPMDAADTAAIYEIIVERHRTAATITTSNREPAEWLALMADPLLAQSAIDRLQSAAFELVLDGESCRHRQRPAISPPGTATARKAR